MIVEAMVEVCDRVVALVRSNALGRRQFFEDHAEPIFRNMMVIHEDYMKAFDDISQMLLDPSISEEQLLARTIGRREECEHLRRLTFDMTSMLAGSRYMKKPKHLSQPKPTLQRKYAAYLFALAVSKYFQIRSGQPSDLPRGPTWLMGVLDLVEIVRGGGMSREECGDHIRGMRKALLSSWGGVSLEYARLRATSL